MYTDVIDSLEAVKTTNSKKKKIYFDPMKTINME